MTPPDTDAIRLALRGRVAPPPLSARYRIALAGAAVVMVALPVACAAVVGSVVALTLLHAATSWRWMTGDHPVAGALAYVLVLAFGASLALMLLKPFLRKRRSGAGAIVLTPEAQPRIHELARATSRLFGAPEPLRIEANCQVNASARLHRSWRAPLGDGLILTVGLPLVAGTDLRQAAGVVAHEIGHFAQGTGMQLTSLVRSVSAWLARLVHERDAWDYRVMRWSEAMFPLSIGLLLLRFMLGLARLVLRAALNVSLLVGSALMRQMELDADAHETAVAGADAAVSTFARITTLTAGHESAAERLSHSWESRVLVDDLPALIVEESTRLRPGLRAKADEELARTSNGWMATHPSNAIRIAAMRARGETGLFTLGGPASELFVDFAALCRDATRSHFALMLGDKIAEARFVSPAKLVLGHEGDRSPEAALRRVLRLDDAAPDDAVLATLELPAIEMPRTPGESLARLKAARARRDGVGRLTAAAELLRHDGVAARLTLPPGAAERMATAWESARVTPARLATLGELALLTEDVERALGLPLDDLGRGRPPADHDS